MGVLNELEKKLYHVNLDEGLPQNILNTAPIHPLRIETDKWIQSRRSQEGFSPSEQQKAEREQLERQLYEYTLEGYRQHLRYLRENNITTE